MRPQKALDLHGESEGLRCVFVPNLWGLRVAAVAATLRFLVIRLRHGLRPAARNGLAYYTNQCNDESSMAKNPPSCPPKPLLHTRPLLSARQAHALQLTFKLLANTTRLRILHALACNKELCVGELAQKIGMKPQAVSNQLQRLADRGIVESRRQGIQIHYSIVDPCVLTLLDQGWCLAEDSQGRKFDRSAGVAS